MLGRQTQLPAHVLGGKLADELVCVLVEQHVVEAYTAAHEDLLHIGQRAQLAQQLQVVAVVDLQALAGLGAQAALADAGPLFQLLGAGGFAEVRRGAANVMDVALEAGQLGDELGLGQDAFVAAALDDAPLVEGQAAKRALAYAAAVARDRELHLLDGGDASGRLVGGVVAALVGQGVDSVHLLGAQRLRGGVLHHVEAVALIGLDQGAPAVGIEVAVLRAKAARVLQAVCLQGLPAGQDDVFVRHAGELLGAVGRAGDPGDLLDGDAGVERVCDGDDGVLAHAVGDEVRPAVEQDGALELVCPVVVVGQPAKRRLDAAQDDGRVLEAAADEVAVDHGGVVRAQAHLAAGGVEVLAAALLGHGVVVDHGVHVAGAHEEGQARLAQGGDACGVVPVWLGDDAHLVALGLEQARDDGDAKGGVVDVGVPADVDEVALFPAALEHLCAGSGKKGHRSCSLRLGGGDGREGAALAVCM